MHHQFGSIITIYNTHGTKHDELISVSNGVSIHERHLHF